MCDTFAKGRSAMKIAFFDRAERELSPGVKGVLFERFSARVLTHVGYRDVTLRRKHSSLEYDLEGVHRASGREMLGEAKAHERSISGKEIAAFVGKTAPLSTAPGIDALFVSVSSLTAEAEDYLHSGATQSLLDTVGCRLNVIAGHELASLACEVGAFPKEETLEGVAADAGFVAFESWIVVADGGWFVAVALGHDVPSGATHVAFFSEAAEPLRLEGEVFERLSMQIPDFGELDLLDLGSEVTHEQLELGADEPTGVIPGVLVGTGWFDYRFPAPPEYFIGREVPLDQIRQLATDIAGERTSLRTIQVLSRSGVGKSSLIVQLPGQLAEVLAASVIVDGRSLRAPLQVRQLVAQVVNAVNGTLKTSIDLPRTQDRVVPALKEVATSAPSSRVVLVAIDQFESLLSLPQAFAALLDVIVQATEAGLSIAWVLGRKNDVTVTFDEGAEVDLARLNELSRSIMLRDFEPDESARLLDALDSEISGLRHELRESVLTFSGGFPWLLKRVCAHVLAVHNQGVSQLELIRTGLRADDLFEEDLAGMTEQDRALLRSMAAYLPATSTELSRRLEGELGARPLATKLREFLSRRLIRLTGDVYDTYNDVFKTYLITGRVPFQSRYVLRVTPGSAMDMVRLIAESGPLTTDELHSKVGGNPTALLNKLRDLRILGLVDTASGTVMVAPEARASMEGRKLGSWLRRRLLSNGLVSDIHQLLLAEERIASDDVSALLRQKLPHIEAQDSTWTHYAKILLSWLRYAGIVVTEGEEVRLREVQGDEVQEDQFYLGTFESDAFLPSVRPRVVKELVEMLGETGAQSVDALRDHFGSKHTGGLLRDAAALGLVREERGRVELSPQGRAFATAPDVSESQIASLALAKPNVLAMIEEAQLGPVTFDKQQAITERFGTAGWQASTWKWRLGILRSWLTRTGQVRSTRKGLVANS